MMTHHCPFGTMLYKQLIISIISVTLSTYAEVNIFCIYEYGCIIKSPTV